jgi:ribosomal protein S18 acetylase RimI-like enzyme
VVELRRALPADADALTDLDRSTWSSLSSPAPVPHTAWAFFDKKTKPSDVLVALVDAVLAGYVKLGSARPLEASDHVCTIIGLAVGVEYRRRGVGRELLRAAAEEARRRGARRLTLRVLAPNEPARRLYESAGFVVEGVQRQEFLIEGEYVDDVLMALDLTTAVS